jgi:iron complex transport system ATP-binding protein
LAFDGVTAGYGARTVLHEVSLRVGPGEIVGLIGPNGAGKTTVIRVASRALRPAAGRATVQGRDPYVLGARAAARLVAVVPQEIVAVFEYSVREIVLMGRTPYLSPWGSGRPEDFEAVRRAMAAAEVEHLADRSLQELSGGERQRVVLAQALAQDAPVLLLDEPTTHLDLRHVVDIMGLLRRQATDARKAILAIFHDLNLASATCDRIVAMEGGRVRSEGSPEEVVTAALIGEVFGIQVDVRRNERTGRPSVVPLG